ncbi:MAG: N-acetylmuramoyl-L-alanine amidase [Gemmatimonadales bacterium]
MTVAPLLLALVLHAPVDSVHVRGVVRDTTLVVVPTIAGGALRADVVLPLIGGSVTTLAPGRWSIDAPGVSFTLVDGVPFATGKDGIIPLAAAPILRNGALLMPLQILADLVPRIGNHIVWDARSRELRAFRNLAKNASSMATPRTNAPRTNVPLAAGARTGEPRASRTPATDAAKSTGAPARAARRRLVVVDAGHGGPDTGMRGPIGQRTTLYEKDITLAIARKLARELESRGVDVLMTRVSDTLIALGDRGKIANRAKGDLFISIHVNAANPNWKDPAAARGFETYFLAEAKTEDERRVAKMENEVVRFESNSDPASASGLGFILKDMAQNEQLRESSDLAGTIESRLARAHSSPDRGVKQAGFVVLVTAFMPSVLVEVGFGTNAAEAAYLSSEAGQRSIASAVADVAIEYLAHYERRVTGAGSLQDSRQ